MTSMTYNSLVLQIENYLERSDTSTVDQIPNFINQGEQRICRESKNIGLLIYVNANFTPGQWVYPKPGRWRRTVTFNYGSGTNNNTVNPMYLRSYEYCRSYNPNPSATTGAPLYYADYGYSNWYISPTPDAAYPFEVGYLELPVPLDATNQTNWLTNFASDLLLYATLLESQGYLKDDERIPVWENYYNRALASLNQQDSERTLDRTSNREAD